MQPSETVIDSGGIFRLRNDSPDQELVIPPTAGTRAYRIPPKKSALVPFEVVRIFWGDPRSREGVYTKFQDSKEKGFINKREDEIKRLGVFYGSYAADVETLLAEEYPPNSPLHGEPKTTPWPVSVQTETGEKVVPACFDTSGTAVYGAVRTESEDLNDAVAYREHVERQFDAMREELKRLRGEDSNDAEVDTPTHAG
jgi:hypothetical protein